MPDSRIPAQPDPARNHPLGTRAETYELIMAAARHMRREWMASLEPWGQSPHEFRALRAAIDHDGAARLADIAERLRIAPRSATEVVDSLQAKGLVERAPSPTDRRSILVVPTAAGREAADAILAGRSALGARMLAPLDADEQEQLRALLMRVLGPDH
jgi:DNA-binding MarR family transcriptional regulator